MRKPSLGLIAFALFFLFFIQMAGLLVESIYILDLMHSSLDAKVLGVLFFFAPALLLPFRKRLSPRLAWLFFGLLFVSRAITPFLPTASRLVWAGMGAAAALLLLPFLATAKIKAAPLARSAPLASAGLALAVGLSVLLRALNYSIDYSLTPGGGWLGILLGLLLGWALTQFEWQSQPQAQVQTRGVTPALLGIFLVITLVYFAFSAPAVIARWSDGSYSLVILMVSLLASGWVFMQVRSPGFPARLSRRGLLIWNGLFSLSLLGATLAQRVAFPPTSGSPAVLVGLPGWPQQIPLVLMLLLFPVIFLDLGLFFETIQRANPQPGALLAGLLLGGLSLVALIFISIFSNVWGYIAPVSSVFRNMFWLPYLLCAGILSLLGWSLFHEVEPSSPDFPVNDAPGWGLFLGALFLLTALSAWQTGRILPAPDGKTTLLVMTYNIQQANDRSGERSFDRQLELIRQVSPDILALQESDSSRIALNNVDIVRYYAGKLGYYSYYGPSTVAGTFGTAILSRYPLESVRTVYTFSDVDEIGTAEAELEVGGRRFVIYDVHPDGSDTAMLVFAKRLLERSSGQANVIALGDYNLREYDEPYRLLAAQFSDAWRSVYPSGINPNGANVAVADRIDHIFVSHDLRVLNAFYLPPPASATDHPAHWAEITWQK